METRPASEVRAALDELIARSQCPTMQVVVTSRANLDVLARRDPALYGGMSLSELETRIYE